MAEALARHLLGPQVEVASCGVYEGMLDPFVPLVLKEKDVPAPIRPPQDFGQVNVNAFDVVIALTAKAAGEARRLGAKVDFWETPNPTDVRGSEAELMEAYRATRDLLEQKIMGQLAKG